MAITLPVKSPYKLIVAGEDGNLLVRELLSKFEVWCSSLDAQCLRLIAAGHHAAVVVREHHNRLAVEVRPNTRSQDT